MESIITPMPITTFEGAPQLGNDAIVKKSRISYLAQAYK